MFRAIHVLGIGDKVVSQIPTLMLDKIKKQVNSTIKKI